MHNASKTGARFLRVRMNAVNCSFCSCYVLFFAFFFRITLIAIKTSSNTQPTICHIGSRLEAYQTAAINELAYMHAQNSKRSSLKVTGCFFLEQTNSQMLLDRITKLNTRQDPKTTGGIISKYTLPT